MRAREEKNALIGTRNSHASELYTDEERDIREDEIHDCAFIFCNYGTGKSGHGRQLTVESSLHACGDKALCTNVISSTESMT